MVERLRVGVWSLRLVTCRPVLRRQNRLHWFRRLANGASAFVSTGEDCHEVPAGVVDLTVRIRGV